MTRLTCTLLLLVLMAGAAWAQPGLERIGEIDWYTDYDQALQVARRENKPLWLHFGENPG